LSQKPPDNLTVTVIEPRRTRLALGLRELWAGRDLLRLLTLRDIQIRYKQTLLGVAWALVQPLITTAIFTIIFSTFARLDTGRIPYPAFVLAGLAIWLFIYAAVTIASASFVNNANLVTKVYFPRLLVPISATLALVLDLAVSLLLLVVLTVYYRLVPAPQMMLAPVFVLWAILLALSLGILLSALTVRFRDVKFILPFALQIWMIATPVFYPLSMIPEKWQLAFAINPLVGLIDGFRSAMFAEPFNWAVIAISAAATASIAVLSVAVFRGMEDDFADVI
jgi:lipopolysaccharide transport system permease protein